MLPVIELNDAGQLAELIARADGDLVREVAAPHAFGAGEQLVHRPGNRSRQRQPHHERDGLNDQEEHADDSQADQDDLPQVEPVETIERRPGQCLEDRAEPHTGSPPRPSSPHP